MLLLRFAGALLLRLAERTFGAWLLKGRRRRQAYTSPSPVNRRLVARESRGSLAGRP
jgi:hypothetical protein